MSRSIEINDIPDAAYEGLQEWAEQDGVSVSELVRRHVLEWAPKEGQLGFHEWIEWLSTQEPLEVPVSRRDILDALHAGRNQD